MPESYLDPFALKLDKYENTLEAVYAQRSEVSVDPVVEEALHAQQMVSILASDGNQGQYLSLLFPLSSSNLTDASARTNCREWHHRPRLHWRQCLTYIVRRTRLTRNCTKWLAYCTCCSLVDSQQPSWSSRLPFPRLTFYSLLTD